MFRPHFVLAVALALGGPAAAQPAPGVSKQLAAILASGDGQAAESAFKVPSVAAEYAVMRQLGIVVRRQSLIFKDKPYDVLEGADADGKPREVWFDISSFYGKAF